MIVTRMPGRSHESPLPPLTAVQAALAARLRAHVETLAGDIGERNVYRFAALRAAAGYVRGELARSGLVVAEQPFAVEGVEVANLCVVRHGTVPGARPLVVGAHYDTVPGSPGANDNASAVAALIEIARLLAGRPLARDVHLVAFVNEEAPFFGTPAMGSLRYAEALARDGWRRGAMLSLETIGYYSDEPGSQRYPFPFALLYPDTGNFLGFVGNLGSRALVRRAVASFRACARFPSEGVAAPGWMTGIGWSDHWAFWRIGWQAVMVTDTALFRYREYHSPADTPDVVDCDRLARVTEGLATVVADLANVASERR